MDITAFGISKQLSDLIGRNVTVKTVDGKTQFAAATRTACYVVEPNQGTAVVQLDLELMASLAGIMIGYSPAEVEQQLKAGKLDENLTDAAREVMNVLSPVIVSSGRAIFKGLYMKALDCSTRAATVLGSAGSFPLRLLVTPAGGKAGCMLIASDSL